MTNKKALVFGETKGLDESLEHRYFKPIQSPRQEKQLTLGFNEPQPKQPKSLRVIQCFDCKRQAELDGYRFALVPLCDCCRTKEELRVLNNRIERRKRQ